MTVLFHLYRRAARERNVLAGENRQLRHELAVARAQHVHDGRRIDDLEAHLELMAIDNTELEKTIAAYTQGIFWFDGRTT